jgi:hypothetical protein
VRFAVVVVTDVRSFVELAESKEPARLVAREVVRALRRAGHRFGEVLSVQAFELGESQYALGGGRVEHLLERD